MVGTAKRLACEAFVLVLLGTMGVSGPARANVNVSIQYDSEKRLELARRILSELESEGYTVEIEAGAEIVPCDSSDAEPVRIGEGTKAWIRLKADPSDDDTVVVSICFLGALPLLQHASSRAPSSDPHQLALATAEALNGLRSRLPPVVEDSPRPGRRELRHDPEHQADETPSREGMNSVALGMAIVAGVPDFPAVPGADLRATLGFTPLVGFAVDVFVPTSGAELTSPEMTATVRTAWVRVGPRLGGELGDFHLSGAVLAGPSLTWGKAVAHAPRIGTTDVSTGAVLSLSGLVEYPTRSPVFASATASPSLLLPGTRVSLGENEPAPRSSWPLEVSIGLGARWGGGR